MDVLILLGQATAHLAGLMALLAIAYGAFERHLENAWLRPGLMGIGFALSLAVVSIDPASYGAPLVDLVAILVVGAAAFAGPIGACIALAAAIATLPESGVAETTMTVAAFWAAAAGLLWRRLQQRVRVDDRRALIIALGVFGATTALVVPTVEGQGVAAALASLSTGFLGTGLPLMGLAILIDRQRTLIARERHWRRRAMTDPLTRLPNRRAFERAATTKPEPLEPTALLVIDLDHFKAINDRHGHAAGDYVLQQVARTIRANQRPQDRPARLGGEEFAVRLPCTSFSRAVEEAEVLRAAIAGQRFVWRGQRLRVTASIGVAAAIGPVPVRRLLEDADVALYTAKDCGRDRVVARPFPLVAEATTVRDEPTAQPRAANAA